LLLDGWGLRGIIESGGVLIPAYLEVCYLLVYAVGPVTIVIVYALYKRELVDRVLVVYLAGTLTAYALFPYFPSAPPRTVFPTADLPAVITPFREFNIWLLGGYGIHSSVFPSAHVSSAFAAAWALLVFLRERKWLGWIMLGYAVSVTIATVYGRYHYAVDALAGFALSVVAGLIARRLRRYH
jgi:membrane-associated phospholipid phosphatase